MRTLLGALLLGVLIGPWSGCQPSRPQPRVPDSTMVHVLTALHLAAVAPADSVSYEARRAAVLQRHNLTEAAFQRAVAAYTAHPDSLNNVYNAVIDSLVSVQQRIAETQRLMLTPEANAPAAP